MCSDHILSIIFVAEQVQIFQLETIPLFSHRKRSPILNFSPEYRPQSVSDLELASVDGGHVA